MGRLGEVISMAETTKHHLFWSIHQKTGLRVLICKNCDSYATMAPKNLLEQCKAAVGRKQNWERIAAGRFPTNRFGNFVNFCSPFTAGEQRVPTFSKSGSKIGSAVLAQRGSSSTEGRGVTCPYPQVAQSQQKKKLKGVGLHSHKRAA